MPQDKAHYLQLLKEDRRACLKALEADFPQLSAKQHTTLRELKTRNVTARSLHEEVKLAEHCETFIHALFEDTPKTPPASPETPAGGNSSTTHGTGNIVIQHGSNIQINQNSHNNASGGDEEKPQNEEPSAEPVKPKKIHWGNLIAGFAAVSVIALGIWQFYKTPDINDPPIFTVERYWLNPKDTTQINIRVVGENEAANKNAPLLLMLFDQKAERQGSDTAAWHFTLPRDKTDSLRKGKTFKTKFDLTCTGCGTSAEKTLSLLGKADNLLYPKPEKAQKSVKEVSETATTQSTTKPKEAPVHRIQLTGDVAAIKHCTFAGETYKPDENGILSLPKSKVPKAKRETLYIFFKDSSRKAKEEFVYSTVTSLEVK